jgi:SAM-dependent methyltransferase
VSVVAQGAIAAPPLSDERLVLEANRLFHDLEGERYEEKHDEIFLAEAERWRRIARRYITAAARGDGERTPAAARAPRRLLDIGTGTGFVPRIVGPCLSAGDEYVLSDLSISMLSCARERLAEAALPCHLRFEPVDGATYPFPSKQFDAITANSVVHHVPDLLRLFSELDRILRPGGLLAIGHEPNLAHYRSRALARAAAVCSLALDPVGGVVRLAKALRLDRLASRLGIRSRVRGAVLRARGSRLAAQVRGTEALLDRVAAQLVEEGLVAAAPARGELVRWIDVHSPTAGPEVDPTRGIDIEKVRRIWLPDYELLHLETYDHLPAGHGAPRTFLRRIAERVLARRFPAAGATLFAVLRKPE